MTRAVRTAFAVAALACAFLALMAPAPAHAIQNTATTVECSPTEALPGSGTWCTATIRRTNGDPGNDYFTNATIVFDGGNIYDTRCHISQGPIDVNSPARCSVRAIPRVRGTTRQGQIRASLQSGGTVWINQGGGGFSDTLGTSQSDWLYYGVGGRLTSSSISCTSPVYYRAQTTCTVTVNDTSSQDIPGDITFDPSPRGTVRIFAGSAYVPGSDSREATCSPVPPAAPGRHFRSSCSFTFDTRGEMPEFRAEYEPGDDIHMPSNASATQITTQKRPTSTSISCSPSTVAVGAKVPCTATVTSPTGVAAEGGISLSPQLGSPDFSGSFDPSHFCMLAKVNATTSSCTLSYSPSGTAPSGRTDTVIAAYQPSTDQWVSTVGSTTVTVTPRASTTSVNCSPSEINSGATTVCSGSVASVGGPLPVGLLTFTTNGNGTVVSGSCITGPGVAPCFNTIRADVATPGLHDLPVTATFTPFDGIHAASSSTSTVKVRVRSTSTQASCAATRVGQETTCTIDVRDTDASGAKAPPTGSVNLSATNGGTAQGSCTLAPVSGSSDTSRCTAGWTPAQVTSGVTATYAGAGAWGSSTGSAAPTVTRRSVSPTVSCTTPPYRASMTCTLTVRDSDAQGTKSAPTGNVSFVSDGNGARRDCVLAPTNGDTASCSISWTQPIGNSLINVAYDGGSAHASRSVSHTVRTESRPTSTAVSCPSGVAGEQNSTPCEITVTDSADGEKGTPRGQVTGTSPGLAGSCELQAVSGTSDKARCTLPYTPPAVGANAVTASYSAQFPHAGSTSSPATVIGAKRASGTTISCPDAGIDIPVVCTATVRDTSGGTKTTPTGTVTLTGDANGSFTPTTCTLGPVAGSADTATCTGVYTPTGEGTNKVSAGYAGDIQHLASSSGSTDVGATRQCVGGGDATFTYTGAESCYRVPTGIDKLRVDVVGAPGGGAGGGAGHHVSGTIAVPSGRRLYVEVGGPGGERAGGWNGGGAGGPADADPWGSPTGGGGASDLRTCARAICALNASDTRLVVAGAGGGSGNLSFTPPNPTEGFGGDAGDVGRQGASLSGGGAPGTATAGGVGGAGNMEWVYASMFPWPTGGSPGTRGQGGDGGQGYSAGEPGGGGGGLFGGGGGGGTAVGRGAGGGGGSSLAPTRGTTVVDTTRNPSIVIRPIREPASVSVALNPTTPVVADGATKVIATATVRDTSNLPVDGDDVAFRSSDPDQKIGTVTDNGDGTYTAEITTSKVAGPATITAAAKSVTPSVEGQTTLVTKAGPVDSIAMTLDKSSLVADGSSSANATVTLKDVNNNPVKDATVGFTANPDRGQSFVDYANKNDGTYTVRVKAGTKAGGSDIVASAGGKTATQSLTQTHGEPATIDVSFAPASVRADGESTTVATAKVFDAFGNPVPGRRVTLTRSRGIYTPSDQGNGVYAAQVTSTTTAGDVEYTATTGDATGKGTLTQDPGEPASIDLTLDPSTPIVADGSSSTSARAEVRDRFGNLVPGASVAFKRDGTQLPGTVQDKGKGVYELPVTSTTTARDYEIEAVVGEHSSKKTLRQIAGDPKNIAVSLDPVSIVADGSSGTVATATVTDAFGNPVPGQDVKFTSEIKDQQPEAASVAGIGIYRSAIKSTKKSGTGDIVAAIGVLEGKAPLTQTPGTATSLEVSLLPATITADGTAETKATATILDANGNGVPGHTPKFETDGGQAIDPTIVYAGDGRYVATIKSTKKSGTSKISASSGGLDDDALLQQKADAPARLELKLGSDKLIANGTDDTTATATVVDANDNPVLDADVKFETNGGQKLEPRGHQGAGVYTARVVSSTQAVPATITATAGKATADAELKQDPDKAAKIEVTLDPASIVADGSSQTKATAIVEDANGNRVSGDPVAFEADGGQDVSAATSKSNGVYEAQITSTKLAGDSKVKAKDGAVESPSVTLRQTPGAPAKQTLTLTPASITADGVDKTQAKVKIEDVNGNGVPGQRVGLATDGGQSIATVDDNDDGTYTAEITSTVTSGRSTITAATPGLQDATAELVQTPGPPTAIELALPARDLTADGEDETIATATLRDANRNPVPDKTVALATDGAQKIGTVTDKKDGTYEAKITASTAAGASKITAAHGDLKAEATLNQVAGAPANLGVTLAPAELVADGSSTTAATAKLTDKFGNPIAGQPVSWESSDDKNEIDEKKDEGGGTYSARVTASTKSGKPQITARLGTSLSGSATLTQKPGAPASLVLALDPDTIVADGTSTTKATATVEDANGNRAPGHTVAFESDGKQDVRSAKDNDDGTYTAEVVSTIQAGTASITASLGDDLKDSKQLTQTEGAPASVDLKLAPDTLVADGAASTTATARVEDVNGNPVRGASLNWSSTDGGVGLGATTDNRDGTYTAPIASSKKAGRPKVTVKAGDASGEAQLTQTPGPPARVRLTLDRASVPADGAQKVKATAIVGDANGNPVAGRAVRVSSSDSGSRVSAVTDGRDGSYTATVTGSRRVGLATITARDDVLSDTASLRQTALPRVPRGDGDGGGAGVRPKPSFRMGKRSSTRASRRGFVTVPASWLVCPAGVVSCELNARLDRVFAKTSPNRNRKRVFASRVSTVVAPGTARVRLRLSRGAREILRRRGMLRMSVVAVATAPDGGSARMKKTFTVRLPKTR